MKNVKLEKEETVKLANIFLYSFCSVYELEKATGVSSKYILKLFRNDLYDINHEMAVRVNNVLERQKAIKEDMYLKTVRR